MNRQTEDANHFGGSAPLGAARKDDQMISSIVMMSSAQPVNTRLEMLQNHPHIHHARAVSPNQEEEQEQKVQPNSRSDPREKKNDFADTSNNNNAGGSSPLSVTDEIYHHHKEMANANMKPKVVVPVQNRRRRRRGIDSPVKVVETRNVYVSAIAAAAPTNEEEEKHKIIGTNEVITPVISYTRKDCGDCAGGGGGGRVVSSFSCTSSITSASGCSSLGLEEVRGEPRLEFPRRYLQPPTPPTLRTLAGGPFTGTVGALETPLPHPSAALAITGTHRRQNTSDSTHSKVAAVARGVSKAAEADVTITTTTLAVADHHHHHDHCFLDRPISIPCRQRTAGTAVTTSTGDASTINKNKTSSSSIITPTPPTKTLKRRAALAPIRRPPRHDNTRVNIRDCIQRMKKSVSSKKLVTVSGGVGEGRGRTLPVADITNGNDRRGRDRPIPCPMRQLTAEKTTKPSSITSDPTSSTTNTTGLEQGGREGRRNSSSEIHVTPESLLQKFDRLSSSINDDMMDDDDTSSFALDKEEAYFQNLTPRTPNPTTHDTMQSNPMMIKAWLEMPTVATATVQPTNDSKEPIPLPTRDPRDLQVTKSEAPLPDTPIIMTPGKQHNRSTFSGYMGDEESVNTGRRSFGEEEDEDEGSIFLNTPTRPSFVVDPPTLPCSEQQQDDDETTANDLACDDRMFRAFLKMPPRLCTTTTTTAHHHPDDVPLYTIIGGGGGISQSQWIAKKATITPQHQHQHQQEEDKVRVTTTNNQATVEPCIISQQQQHSPDDDELDPVVAAEAEADYHNLDTIDMILDTPIINRQIHTDFCLDISAIEMSIDLSLPSFFADCRGGQHATPGDPMMAIIQPSALLRSCSSSNNTNSIQSQNRWRTMIDVDDDNWKPRHHQQQQQQQRGLEGSTASSRRSSFSIPSSLLVPATGAGGITKEETQGDHHHVAAALGGSSSSGCSLSISDLAAKADLERRMSLPPVMPHRRKPSLHIDYLEDEKKDDFNDGEGEENKEAIQAMWSSMPVLSSTTSPDYTNTRIVSPPKKKKLGGLRSSWPTKIMLPPSAGGDHSAPPCIPNRFRRQDSLLSTEANCETMAPTTTKKITDDSALVVVSPRKRSSMPPLQPHRRKPSLTLEGIATPAAEVRRGAVVPAGFEQQQQKHNQDYCVSNTQQNLWSSLPAGVFASAAANAVGGGAAATERRSLPPSMPHRRKPSLNISDDGAEDGMIEMWLSANPHHSHRRQQGQSSTSPVASNCAPVSSSTIDRPCHTRQDSFGGNSVASIVLKEGEAEI